MNTKERLIQDIQNEIDTAKQKLLLIEEIEGLENLTLHCSFFGGVDRIDFDRLSYDQVIEVIKALGGTWTKTPADEGTVDYETKIGGITIRMWHGQPPPNCKIVETLVEVPAQPARMITIKKLQCQ